MKKALVILGPTAIGKTDIALKLAKKFKGEIVSCDSRQVYKGLDIGTGKMPGADVGVKKASGHWIMDGINVWMYDVADPNKQYTVFEYIKDAGCAVKDISERGKLPIIVGGTGFYLKALLDGLSNLSIPTEPNLREELESLSLEDLQKRLQDASPEKWRGLNQSDRQNRRRLLRSIEIISMYPYVDESNNIAGLSNCYEILKFGLTLPRQDLNKKIDLRVLSRLDQGMVKEAKELCKKGLSLLRMRELGLEYRVLADFLDGTIGSKEELVQVLKNKSHQYAKRQMTWFKREKDVFWVDVGKMGWDNRVEKQALDWYNSK